MRTSPVPALMAVGLLLAAGQPPIHARSSLLRREGRSSPAAPSYSPHVSVGVLTDLRKFFEELQDELNAYDQQEQENEEEGEAMFEAVRALAAESEAAPSSLPDPRKANQMRFVPRATQRKIKLNPSLLRSGLGRK